MYKKRERKIRKREGGASVIFSGIRHTLSLLLFLLLILSSSFSIVQQTNDFTHAYIDIYSFSFFSIP
jgi:hypothetical protein